VARAMARRSSGDEAPLLSYGNMKKERKGQRVAMGRSGNGRRCSWWSSTQDSRLLVLRSQDSRLETWEEGRGRERGMWMDDSICALGVGLGCRCKLEV
jgi:hypothetical protein